MANIPGILTATIVLNYFRVFKGWLLNVVLPCHTLKVSLLPLDQAHSMEFASLWLPPKRLPLCATPSVAPWAAEGGFPARLRDGQPRGGGGGDRRAGAPLERPDVRARPLRHHRRCSRLLRRARGAARRARVRGPWRSYRAGRPRPAAPLCPPRGPQGRLPRRPRGPWPPHPRLGAARAEHGRPTAPRSACRQPRPEALEEAPRQERPDHARPGRHAGRDRRPARRGAGLVLRGARRFLDGLVSHYVLDDGKLVVAHAGMKQEMQGRGSGKVRDFALYGETTGETDEFGLPVRYDWAAEYRGEALVVYGHTPVPEPEWLNRTINIDTGCVFGAS